MCNTCRMVHAMQSLWNVMLLNTGVMGMFGRGKSAVMCAAKQTLAIEVWQFCGHALKDFGTLLIASCFCAAAGIDLAKRDVASLKAPLHEWEAWEKHARSALAWLQGRSRHRTVAYMDRGNGACRR